MRFFQIVGQAYEIFPYILSEVLDLEQQKMSYIAQNDIFFVYCRSSIQGIQWNLN